METKTEACPYRRAILWLAFLLQVICFACLKPFSVSINPYILIFMPYIGPALIGEFLIYRILGKRDSHAANPQLVKDKFNLTLEELDIYIQKLINIRLMATVVAAISFGIGYVLDLPLYVVFATYLITTFGAMIYLRIKKDIKVPKRFFLIEGGKLNPHFNPKGIKVHDGPFISDSGNGYWDNNSLAPIANSRFQKMEFSSSNNESFQSSSFQSPHYGMSGYNSSGIYTGSSTAIGGISD